MLHGVIALNLELPTACARKHARCTFCRGARLVAARSLALIMAQPPETCHVQWHDGVTGTLFMDCCDARVEVPAVWNVLNDAMSMQGKRPSSPGQFMRQCKRCPGLVQLVSRVRSTTGVANRQPSSSKPRP